MTETKNAALDATNIENGVELKSVGRAALPCSEYDSITGNGVISRALSGCREPVTAEELACILGVDDRRVITRMVQHERLHGAPICASCDAERPGFYLARRPEELDRYLRSLDRRIRAVSSTFRALEATRDAWCGQMRLDEGGTDDGK